MELDSQRVVGRSYSGLGPMHDHDWFVIFEQPCGRWRALYTMALPEF